MQLGCQTAIHCQAAPDSKNRLDSTSEIVHFIFSALLFAKTIIDFAKFACFKINFKQKMQFENRFSKAISFHLVYKENLYKFNDLA